MSDDAFRLGVDLTHNKPLIIPNRRLVTKRGFFFGQNESGKTTAATTYIEGLLRLGVTVAILDVVGIWGPGLSLKANGKTASEFSLAVFGGQHGFKELRPDMGEAIARMVIEERYSTVLDLSWLDSKEQMQTVANFARGIAKFNSRAKRLTVIAAEEANRFLPQVPEKAESSQLAAYEMKRLSDVGRNWGIGLLGISPSPQQFDKAIMGQAAFTLWMRSVEPRVVGEASKRIEMFPDKELVRELISKIPAFSAGEGVFVSTQWMNTLVHVKVDLPTTYHFDPEAQEGAFDDAALARTVNKKKLHELYEKFMSPNDTEKTTSVPKSEAKFLTRLEEKDRFEEERNAYRKTINDLQAALDGKEEDFTVRETESVNSAVAGLTEELEKSRLIIAGVGALVREAGGEVGTFTPVTPTLNIPKITRLAQRVAENVKITKAGKAVFQCLVDNLPYHPNGMTREHIGIETGYTLKSLSNAIPELKKRLLVNDINQLISINQDSFK